jgi:hypothetical protein
MKFIKSEDFYETLIKSNLELDQWDNAIIIFIGLLPYGTLIGLYYH